MTQARPDERTPTRMSETGQMLRGAPSGVTTIWTRRPGSLGQTREDADPLGLRSAANRVARRLVPALTKTSFRVRGFALLCFGLDAARRGGGRAPTQVDGAFLRFERLVVYAQRQHYRAAGRLPASVRYAGTRRAFSRLSSATGLDLDRPLLLNGDLSGLWSSYRRPALRLGLIRPVAGGSRPSAVEPTPLGSRLAAALHGSAIADVNAVRRLVRGDARVAVEMAGEIIAKDEATPSGSESAVLGEAMSGLDERSASSGAGRPFAALLAAYDAAGGSLTIDGMPRALLTEQQREALEDAVAISRLLDEVEVPYRRWVTGSDATVDLDFAAPEWRRVELMGEPDLLALRAELQRESTLDAVHRWHQRLSVERGREAWEQGEDRPGRRSPLSLDFTLSTISRLFDEGVHVGKSS